MYVRLEAQKDILNISCNDVDNKLRNIVHDKEHFYHYYQNCVMCCNLNVW